jgi:hypothetical protein
MTSPVLRGVDRGRLKNSPKYVLIPGTRDPYLACKRTLQVGLGMDYSDGPIKWPGFL